MNRVSSEMFAENAEMSVLERQRARLNWQQENLIQHQPFTYFNENEHFDGAFLMENVGDHGFGELLMGRAMKPDPGFEDGWNGLNYGNESEFEMSCALPRTVSCPPAVAAVAANGGKGKEAALSSATGKESFKKRKADKNHIPKVAAEEKSQDKKMKGGAEEDTKITEQNSNSKSTITTANDNNKGTSDENLNDNSKPSEAPKLDYIHVRARRGQATDSHSLAERVRREKISERMKYLQDLVPGCNKITGKAGMLDEIINYVQSLQRQVEFLSMKLAVMNPRLDFETDNYLAKEMFQVCASSIQAIGSSVESVNPTHLQFNGLGKGVSSCGLETGPNPPDVALRRTISAPVSIPDSLFDSSCLNQIQSLTWDAEIQNLYGMEYQQGRSTSFASQPFSGFIDASNVKQEM